MVVIYANLSLTNVFFVFAEIANVKLWQVHRFSPTQQLLHAALNIEILTYGWKLCKDSITIEMDLQELYRVQHLLYKIKIDNHAIVCAFCQRNSRWILFHFFAKKQNKYCALDVRCPKRMSRCSKTCWIHRCQLNIKSTNCYSHWLIKHSFCIHIYIGCCQTIGYR